MAALSRHLAVYFATPSAGTPRNAPPLKNPAHLVIPAQAGIPYSLVGHLFLQIFPSM